MAVGPLLKVSILSTSLPIWFSMRSPFRAGCRAGLMGAIALGLTCLPPLMSPTLAKKSSKTPPPPPPPPPETIILSTSNVESFQTNCYSVQVYRELSTQRAFDGREDPPREALKLKIRNRDRGWCSQLQESGPATISINRAGVEYAWMTDTLMVRVFVSRRDEPRALSVSRLGLVTVAEFEE